MASSSTSPPSSPWVVLARVALAPRDEPDEPQELSVEVKLQPRLSTLTVPASRQVEKYYGDGLDDYDEHPYVVAAADGVLLLHLSSSPFVGFNMADYPMGRFVLVRDFRPAVHGARRAVGTAVRVPTLESSGVHYPDNLRSIGLVSLPGSGGADYVIAELRLRYEDDHATLLSFRSGTDRWIARNLRCPAMDEVCDVWLPHDVVAHEGKLWWVSLVCGLLGCDPFLDEPLLRYVALPSAFADGREVEPPPVYENCRMVRVSQGKLVYVLIARGILSPQGETAVLVKSLNLGLPGDTRWEERCCRTLATIWATDSYESTGMPQEVPVLAMIDPNNPDVVYFFLQHYLFAINLAVNLVTEFVPEPCGVEVISGCLAPPISWRYVLVWELPPGFAGNWLNSAVELVQTGTSASLEEAHQRVTKCGQPANILAAIGPLPPQFQRISPAIEEISPTLSDGSVLAVYDVWADTADWAFRKIKELLQCATTRSFMVGMDTEFVVPDRFKPFQGEPATADKHYEQLCSMVNGGNLIQIGIAIADSQYKVLGQWQFNIQFDPSWRLPGHEGVAFLQNKAKINMEEHARRGIPDWLFIRLLVGSGSVFNDSITWVVFHGSTDFGFLVQLLNRQSTLPARRLEFLNNFWDAFPRSYDVRVFTNLGKCRETVMKGGLQTICEKLGVQRIGTAHNAGSDALAVLQCLEKMVRADTSFATQMQRYCAVLYGVVDHVVRDHQKVYYHVVRDHQKVY